jgi:glutamate synthase (NADPH/NADH) small chain
MAERLNNDFQFLDVPRQDPEKKDITVRKAEFVEIYKPLQRKWLQTRLIVV